MLLFLIFHMVALVDRFCGSVILQDIFFFFFLQSLQLGDFEFCGVICNAAYCSAYTSFPPPFFSVQH